MRKRVFPQRQSEAVILEIVVLAAIYFGAARLGLSLAFNAEQVTAIWPPTGIALAAVILRGYRVWPGIFLGAFVANLLAAEPVATACGIAVGNTLEACLGGWLLRRFANVDPSFSRPKDVLCFTILGAMVGPIASATIGVTSLCLGGVHPWEMFPSLWQLWWMGDATGAIIFGPILLVWFSKPIASLNPRRTMEGVILVAGLVVVGMTGLVVNAEPFKLAVFPFIIWAALRFDQRGAAAMTVVVSTIAVWNTLKLSDALPGPSIDERLVMLQLFIATVSVTGLLLGAALAGRRQTEEILKEAYAKAEAASKAKSEFLAHMSHEIRTPMNAVLGVSHILSMSKPLTVKQQELIDMMRLSANSLLGLINNLLDIAKIEASSIELEHVAFNLNEIIDETIQVLSTQANEKNIALTRTLIAGDAPLYFGDPTRIRQIAMNLIANAIKFTEVGGVHIEVSLAPCEKPRHHSVCITVKDTGIGIPQEKLEQIFEKFTQADMSITRKYGGSGLGLAICKNLAEMMGGTITIQSKPGVGSEFTVHLPLECAQPLPKTPLSQSSDQNLSLSH